jgi:hypothetical protein
LAEEEGAYMLLTNCPPCILSLKGLELMQESGKPMEFGIFDFYKVFSRAFGEEGNGAGDLEWKVRDVVTDPDWKIRKASMLMLMLYWFQIRSQFIDRGAGIKKTFLL